MRNSSFDLAQGTSGFRHGFRIPPFFLIGPVEGLVLLERLRAVLVVVGHVDTFYNSLRLA